jgi:Bacterial Ig-like domain (group 2)
MRSSLFRLLPLLLAGALAAACGDAPTDTPTDAHTAQLGFSVNVSGTDVRRMVVDVTAPDISQPLVYNVDVVDGVVSGRIDVPPGPARTIRVRAYDVALVQTHEGSTTTDVRPGSNQPVTVTLTPAAGRVPLAVGFGSVVVTVRAVDGPNAPTGEYIAGTSARFEATVATADGTPIPHAVVRWASLNPSIASIGDDGVATALAAGGTQVVATWNGHGSAIGINVTEKTDFVAPTLQSLSFDSATITVTPGWARNLRLRAGVQDDASGIAETMVQIRGTTNPGNGWNCYPLFSASLGTYTCNITVASWTLADTYEVTRVEVTDNAGNRATFTKADLAARGIAPRVTVVHGS